jgi:hypothetical protein
MNNTFDISNIKIIFNDDKSLNFVSAKIINFRIISWIGDIYANFWVSIKLSTKQRNEIVKLRNEIVNYKISYISFEYKNLKNEAQTFIINRNNMFFLHKNVLNIPCTDNSHNNNEKLNLVSNNEKIIKLREELKSYEKRLEFITNKYKDDTEFIKNKFYLNQTIEKIQNEINKYAESNT